MTLKKLVIKGKTTMTTSVLKVKQSSPALVCYLYHQFSFPSLQRPVEMAGNFQSSNQSPLLDHFLWSSERYAVSNIIISIIRTRARLPEFPWSEVTQK